MIPFTQFCLPDGRRKAEHIERPSDIEDMAKAVIAKGGRFEAEILRTGHVSLECVRDNDGETESIAIQLVDNGPGVPGAVDRLVKAAYAAVTP